MNRVRQKFGMVFQYAALLDSLTVFENVAFPLREHRKQMSKKEIREQGRSRCSTRSASTDKDAPHARASSRAGSASASASRAR